jgi:hypothetical protein
MIKKLSIKTPDFELIKCRQNIINFHKNKLYHIHNSYHLGDNVFNFILFYQIKNYIEENNITIFYYAKKDYLPQLKQFICSKNIILSSIETKPYTSIELWINNGFFEYRHDKQVVPINYNLYYKNFLNQVLRKFYIPLKVEKFFYHDYDLIQRFENISDKYKNFDILILNSQPFSGQYNYNKGEWDNYIINLKKNSFKILTTTKVQDIICTSDDKLTIKDIASLSTKAKVIIAINSGVVPGLLNIYTLQNVKHFYIFDKKSFYSYPNFENKEKITDIQIRELEKYLKE